MSERACTFGSESGLAGILCEPHGGSARGVPGVLLLNAGLDHHVGPNRLNVDLARHLASLGFTSLRFDLSGLGDSEPRRDQRSDEARAIVDVAEAMEFLGERRGISGFVVIALCSGVDPAHVVALRHPRVCGAVFMNGYEYPTVRSQRRHRILRLRRLVSPASYARWLRRRVGPRLGGRGRPEVGRAPIFVRSYPPVTQFRADLRAMLDRGVKLLFLYTRHHYDFGRIGQFADMIDEPRVPDGIEVEYWPGLDHVLTPVAERGRAVRGIGAWALARFGANVAAEGAARSVV
jgi:pimeloyl-ACP methyl ester carboxylesterase